MRRKYIFMAFYDRFQCPSIVCITNENTDLEIEHLLLTDYEQYNIVPAIVFDYKNILKSFSIEFISN